MAPPAPPDVFIGSQRRCALPDENHEKPVLYMPDSPNVGAADPDGDPDDPKRAAKDQARADDLAAKVAIGDELSGYEKVAGRGVPRD